MLRYVPSASFCVAQKKVLMKEAEQLSKSRMIEKERKGYDKGEMLKEESNREGVG